MRVFSFLHLWTLIAPVLIVTGCGKVFLQVVDGGFSGIKGLNAAPAGSGFYDRCGIRVSDISDPNAVVVDQRLRAIVNLTANPTTNPKVPVRMDLDLQADVHAVGGTQKTVTETILKLAADRSDDGQNPDFQNQIKKQARR